MLQEMLKLQKQIEEKNEEIEANNRYLERPKQKKNYFPNIIFQANLKNQLLRENITKLTTKYNELLKELILNEVDFDMIFDIFENDIEEYVTENCKKRYTQKEMYL